MKTCGQCHPGANANFAKGKYYVEIVEIPGHPFFLGCQFHPEFKSKPLEPHPLFRDFIGASYKHRSVAPGASRVEEGVAAQA